jgi:caa(3)-type oxidase subunit IV
MHSDVAEVKKSVRTYLMVFGALMALTIVTVAAASLEVGVAVGVAIALAIAVTKGSLVAAIFMHLNHEKRWIYGTLILTGVFFVVLLLLPVFTTFDTFGEHVIPAGAEAAEHAGH